MDEQKQIYLQLRREGKSPEEAMSISSTRKGRKSLEKAEPQTVPKGNIFEPPEETGIAEYTLKAAGSALAGVAKSAASTVTGLASLVPEYGGKLEEWAGQKIGGKFGKALEYTGKESKKMAEEIRGLSEGITGFEGYEGYTKAGEVVGDIGQTIIPGVGLEKAALSSPKYLKMAGLLGEGTKSAKLLKGLTSGAAYTLPQEAVGIAQSGELPSLEGVGTNYALNMFNPFPKGTLGKLSKPLAGATLGGAAGLAAQGVQDYQKGEVSPASEYMKSAGLGASVGAGGSMAIRGAGKVINKFSPEFKSWWKTSDLISSSDYKEIKSIGVDPAEALLARGVDGKKSFREYAKEFAQRHLNFIGIKNQLLSTLKSLHGNDTIGDALNLYERSSAGEKELGLFKSIKYNEGKLSILNKKLEYLSNQGLPTQKVESQMSSLMRETDVLRKQIGDTSILGRLEEINQLKIKNRRKQLTLSEIDRLKSDLDKEMSFYKAGGEIRTGKGLEESTRRSLKEYIEQGAAQELGTSENYIKNINNEIVLSKIFEDAFLSKEASKFTQATFFKGITGGGFALYPILTQGRGPFDLILPKEEEEGLSTRKVLNTISMMYAGYAIGTLRGRQKFANFLYKLEPSTQEMIEKVTRGLDVSKYTKEDIDLVKDDVISTLKLLPPPSSSSAVYAQPTKDVDIITKGKNPELVKDPTITERSKIENPMVDVLFEENITGKKYKSMYDYMKDVHDEFLRNEPESAKMVRRQEKLGVNMYEGSKPKKIDVSELQKSLGLKQLGNRPRSIKEFK